jgi:hypothetical protein
LDSPSQNLGFRLGYPELCLAAPIFKLEDPVALEINENVTFTMNDGVSRLH